MKNRCDYIFKSSYKYKLVGSVLLLLPLAGSALMVWAKLFYKPDDWYVTFAWVIALSAFIWGFYTTIKSNAIIRVNNKLFEYEYRGNKKQLNWDDIKAFKVYKSSMLDNTTAGAIVPKKSMPLEIGLEYSNSYNNGKLTKSEKDLMKIEGVHYNFPLGTNFEKKHDLIKLLNKCVKNNTS